MGCDIGAIEITNTKLNTSTGLFLRRWSAEQPKTSASSRNVSPSYIFSKRELVDGMAGEAREEVTEREEKGGQRIRAPGCVCRFTQARLHARTHTQEPTGTAAAIAVQRTPQQFALRNKDISSRQKQLLAVAMTT